MRSEKKRRQAAKSLPNSECGKITQSYRTRADERAACIRGATSKQGSTSLGDHRQFTLSTPLDGNDCIGRKLVPKILYPRKILSRPMF